MRRKLSKHGIEFNESGARVREALVELGVSIDHDEGNAFALRYAERVRDRYGDPHAIPNVCAHPFWVHVARVHGTERMALTPGCKPCALLFASWLPYKLEVSQRDERTLQTSKACSQVQPLLAKLQQLLAWDPEAEEDVALLALAEQAVLFYGARHQDAVDPEVRQALRVGRRSNDLLREIESVLHRAGFRDREIACLLFGDPQVIQSIRDRRRKRPTDLSKGLEQ